ncbi:MAG: AI-2E family transporter [Alloprevotella sp.]|jgi:putative membrane protein|nr:AI-2E family transporter [Alloprevotella sp.]RKV82913.1 MAG: AI-2E family transporter [Alloprevotella sp.]
MQIFRQEITFDRFIRGTLFVALLALFVAGINWLSAVLLPFFAAWAIAWILAPVVNFLYVRCYIRPRFLAVILTLIGTTAIAVGALWLIVPPFLDGILHIKDALLRYLQNDSGHVVLPNWMQNLLQEWLDALQLEHKLKQGNVLQMLRTSLPHVWNVVQSTANVVISLASSAFALLYLVLLLADYDHYATVWLKYVPRSQRAFLEKLSNDAAHNMRGYFRGQMLVAISNGVMFSIGFWLIGLPMPVGMGIFVGVLSFIPYIQVLGILPAALLSLLQMADTGSSFWGMMALVFLVYVVVQVLQDTIFTPRIMGQIMGLSPAVVLLSLSVWGYIAGIIGLMVALPLTTLMLAYYQRYILEEPAQDESYTDETLEAEQGE